MIRHPAFVTIVVLAVAACSATPAPSATASPAQASPPAASLDPRLPRLDTVAPEAVETALATFEQDATTRTTTAAGVDVGLGPGVDEWLDAFRREMVDETLAALKVTGTAAETASLGPWPLTAQGESGGLALAASLVAILAGLDAATPGTPGSVDAPGLDETRETSDAGRRVSARVSTSISITYEGARVRAVTRISIRVTLADAATGTAPGTVSVVSTGSVEVDYCPDPGGGIHGRMQLEIAASSTIAGAPPPARSLVHSEIVGSVDDAAFLAGYRVEGEAEASSGAAGSETGLRVELAGDVGLRTPGDVHTAEARSASGRVVRDDPSATDADVSALYRQVATLGGFVAGVVATKAQDKWRGGACVRIEAGGERSRSVGAEERITLSASPYHILEKRELDKPIVASLAGEGRLEPNAAAQQPPATMVYTAGDQDGATGTVTIESISNRGIGRLVIEYTVGQAWAIRVDGAWSSTLAGVEFSGTVTGTISHVTLGAESRGSPAAGEGVRISASMSAAGCTLTFAPSVATLIVRAIEHGETEVSLQLGIEDEGPSTTTGVCPQASILVDAIGAAGMAVFWAEALPEVIVARSGGTVTANGTEAFGPFPIQARATITLTPAE